MQQIRRHPELKSCMKVTTVEESLKKADENENRRNAMTRGESRRGMLKRGVSIRASVSKRGSMLQRGLSIRGGMKNAGGAARRRGSSSGGWRGSVSRGLSKTGAFLSRRHLRRSSATFPIDEDEQSEMSTERDQLSKVSFDTLRFRWYEFEAVDNPGVSKGFAIGIGGWDYEEDESPIPVDVHEEYRLTTAPRRKLDEIKISEEERYRRLVDSGVTRAELARVRKQINIAKGRRKKTLEESANMKNEERREGAIRKLKKMLGIKKDYDKEVKELWDAAQKHGGQHSVVMVQ